MKITDKEVLRQLKIVNCPDLEENIKTIPECEVNERSDLEILKEELEYLLDLYESEGCCRNECLMQAKSFMRETKKGKVMPCYNTFPPVPKYTVEQLKLKLEGAKDILNEYARLKRLKGRLWC